MVFIGVVGCLYWLKTFQKYNHDSVTVWHSDREVRPVWGSVAHLGDGSGAAPPGVKHHGVLVSFLQHLVLHGSKKTPSGDMFGSSPAEGATLLLLFIFFFLLHLPLLLVPLLIFFLLLLLRLLLLLFLLLLLLLLLLLILLLLLLCCLLLLLLFLVSSSSISSYFSYSSSCYSSFSFSYFYSYSSTSYSFS